jgi:hypothetical protein
VHNYKGTRHLGLSRPVFKITALLVAYRLVIKSNYRHVLK